MEIIKLPVLANFARKETNRLLNIVIYIQYSWQLLFSVDLVPPLVFVVAAAAAAVPDHFVNNWNLAVSHDSYYLMLRNKTEIRISFAASFFNLKMCQKIFLRYNRSLTEMVCHF